jgi:nucleotide-binding universal stress UspA family protein
MIQRILVGVDDSPASLAAARAALGMAASCGAGVRVVHVLFDGALDEVLFGASRQTRAGGPAGLGARRARAGSAVLAHVADLASRAGVAAHTAQLAGDPADVLLADAEAWPADVIVLGRGDQPGDRQPALGPHARRVVEFTSRPVLLVPPTGRVDARLAG